MTSKPINSAYIYNIVITWINLNFKIVVGLSSCKILVRNSSISVSGCWNIGKIGKIVSGFINNWNCSTCGSCDSHKDIVSIGISCTGGNFSSLNVVRINSWIAWIIGCCPCESSSIVTIPKSSSNWCAILLSWKHCVCT